MSFCSEEKTVVARKVHRCHWCGQRIEIGSQYVTYCYGNDDGVARMKMHPECHEACGKWVEQTGETEFDAYTWTRGCTCEAGDRGHGTYPTCTNFPIQPVKPIKPLDRTDVYPRPDGKLVGEVAVQHYDAATGQYETVLKSDLVG